MHIAAGILYALAAAFEIAGVVLVVRLAFKIRRMLRTGALSRIDAGDASGQKSQPDSLDMLALLAEDASSPWIASALLIAGILAGTVGNFLMF
jgi:hypothetical protein